MADIKDNEGTLAMVVWSRDEAGVRWTWVRVVLGLRIENTRGRVSHKLTYDRVWDTGD